MRWSGVPVWRIEYTDIAEEAILSLDKPVRLRILSYMRNRVESADDPKVLAEPLYGEFLGLWRFRVGDYRIICDIQTSVKIVELLDAFASQQGLPKEWKIDAAQE